MDEFLMFKRFIDAEQAKELAEELDIEIIL